MFGAPILVELYENMSRYDTGVYMLKKIGQAGR